MRVVGFIAVALALALVSSQTSAFEQQGGGQVPAAETPSAAAPADQQPAPSALTGDNKAAAGDNAGTEVRIPGLGKLGVLPKMDFGLELLYGANEQKSIEAEGQQPADDLTIRGSMKHNF